MDYVALVERLGKLNDQIFEMECQHRLGDLRRLCELRLERAEVALQLRDLWGPWSSRGHRFNSWMWDDIEQAQAIAKALGDEFGDPQLLQRLLLGRPKLQQTLMPPHRAQQAASC